MPRKQLNRYFVDIRLNNENNRHSLHINACSKVGAIFQATLLLKEQEIEDVYAIVVKKEAYPVELNKRKKAIKLLNQKQTQKKDNKKALELIKSRINTNINQKGDSL